MDTLDFSRRRLYSAWLIANGIAAFASFVLLFWIGFILFSLVAGLCYWGRLREGRLIVAELMGLELEKELRILSGEPIAQEALPDPHRFMSLAARMRDNNSLGPEGSSWFFEKFGEK